MQTVSPSGDHFMAQHSSSGAASSRCIEQLSTRELDREHFDMNFEPSVRSVNSTSSVPPKVDDTGRLSDAFTVRSLDDTGRSLASHLSSVSQVSRLQALEEKAANAAVQMSEVRNELARAEAQEAVQVVKWRELYREEAKQARAVRDKVESVEVRLESSALLAAEANANKRRVERLRMEFAENDTQCVAERDRLRKELDELHAVFRERDNSSTCLEHQVQAAAATAAQATLERCSNMEEIVAARAKAAKATAQAEASSEALQAANERTARAASSVGELECQIQTSRTLEARAVSELQQEVRAEANEAAETVSRLGQLLTECASDDDATSRARALQRECRRDKEEAMRIHADQRQALEHFLASVDDHSKANAEENSSAAGMSDMDRLRCIQQRLATRISEGATSEVAAAAEAHSEAIKAAAMRQSCNHLREELAVQANAQRDLHSELQELSKAAAAVRAVASAKDQTIADLQAAQEQIASEIAAKRIAEMQSKGNHQKGDSGSVSGESRSVPSEIITSRDLAVASVPSEMSPPQTPFDTMSVASTTTVKSAPVVPPKGRDGTSDTRVNMQLFDFSTVVETSLAQPPVAAPASGEIEAFQAKDQMEATHAAPTLPIAAAGSGPMGSGPVGSGPVGSGPVGSGPVGSGSGASTGSTAFSSTVPAPASPESSPSWDEAQAAMTAQIRRDIGLLRKAMSDSGMTSFMTGQNLDEEVKALLQAADVAVAIQSLHQDSPMAASPKRAPFAKEMLAASRSALNRPQAASLEPSRSSHIPDKEQPLRPRSQSRGPKPQQGITHASTRQNAGVAGTLDGSARMPGAARPGQVGAVGSSEQLPTVNIAHSANAVRMVRNPGTSEGGSIRSGISRDTSASQLPGQRQTHAAVEQATVVTMNGGSPSPDSRSRYHNRAVPGTRGFAKATSPPRSHDPHSGSAVPTRRPAMLSQMTARGAAGGGSVPARAKASGQQVMQQVVHK